ncbi:unnamed protein product [Calicophoron daubneyi]|uniref:C2H2-type domain-containing protein n=1 Tax=Calicophoron daubneyi TaxID=300641 RepID=A0AAV2TAT7_CALDB
MCAGQCTGPSVHSMRGYLSYRDNCFPHEQFRTFKSSCTRNSSKPTDHYNYIVSDTPYGESYLCTVCNVTCTGRIPYEQHVYGAQHKKNCSKKVSLMCDLCSILFNSAEAYEAHMSGSKHKRKVKQDMITQAKSAGLPDEDCSEVFKCVVCDLVCSSDEQLQDHLKGKKHTKRLKEKQLSWEVDSQTESNRSVPSSSPKSVGSFTSHPPATPVQSSVVDKFERISITPPSEHIYITSRVMDLEAAISKTVFHTLQLPACYHAPVSAADEHYSSCIKSVTKYSEILESQTFCTHSNCVISRALKFYEMSLRCIQDSVPNQTQNKINYHQT